MRKSSVHFEPVSDAAVSIAHATRTEEKEPAYLLPQEHRLENVIVPGSISNIKLGLEFIRVKANMTGQAKARGSSPFWEGVVVLDGTDFKAHTASLQVWKKEYEQATGQSVLHIAIHGDEGFVNSEGKPEYNIHAHVTVNRLNEAGRIIKLGRAQLSAVQDLTAKALNMQRGETLEDRNGMRGRKHMNHREFRRSENDKRLQLEAVQLIANKVPSLEATVTSQAGQISALKAQIEADYKANRAAMVASKTASQADYQALKKAHAEEIAKLETEANAGFETYRASAKKIDVKVRKVVMELRDRVTGLEADKAQLSDELAKRTPAAAEKLTEKDSTTPPGPLLHAGGGTAVFSSESSERGMQPGAGVSTASLHGVAPHTPSPEDTQRVRQRPQTAPGQPKTQKPSSTGAEPEKSDGEGFKEFLKVVFQKWVDFIKKKGFNQAELDVSKGQYAGAILASDSFFAVQETGENACVIHPLNGLDANPELENPDIFICYRDGVGQVSGQQIQHPERPEHHSPGGDS